VIAHVDVQHLVDAIWISDAVGHRKPSVEIFTPALTTAEVRFPFTVFGGFWMESLADGPYKPHLPYPVAYRVVGIGEVELTGLPTNPPGG